MNSICCAVQPFLLPLFTHTCFYTVYYENIYGTNKRKYVRGLLDEGASDEVQQNRCMQRIPLLPTVSY